jgi:uncharacterized protein (TIGR00730 family)
MRRIAVVYGGASVGLMGALADAALGAGGLVTGVIPRSLMDREVAHSGLTDLVVVESMHARKAEMSRLSDGFIALPGGAGTMEELFEVWTWGLLGLHSKPFGLLDASGYFDELKVFLDKMVSEGFLRSEYRKMLHVEEDPGRLLDLLDSYEPPVKKWSSAISPDKC